MKILGLDVGITSIGFTLVDLERQAIITMGSHVFEAAENPKDGASLAAPRREKRLQRRRLERRARRKAVLKNLLSRHLGTPVHDWFRPDHDLHGSTGLNGDQTVWDLRKEGLDRLLTPEEFARVLMHIANHRGFQSNRKSAAKNTDEGVMNSAATELEEALVASGSRTIGAYLATLEKKKNLRGSYLHTVKRDLLRSEVDVLFASQRRFGNAAATEDLKAAFVDIAFSQRPIKSVIGLVGLCSLEPEELRAPRRAYSAELFVALLTLNNLRIRTYRSRSGERHLTDDERTRLLALLHKRASVTYAQARKELALSDEDTFNLVTYRKAKEADTSFEAIRDTAEKNKKLGELAGYHALRKVFEPLRGETGWQALKAERHTLDRIAHALSFYKGDREVRSQLEGIEGLSAGEIDALLPLQEFSKTVDISLKAIDALLPHLTGDRGDLPGMDYRTACEEAGYDMSVGNAGLALLPPFEDVPNPVVNRALARCRKVINAVIRKYGMPDIIHIELLRDLGRNFQDRRKIETENNKFRIFKEEQRATAQEEIFGHELSGEEFAKYRLWKEQEGFCPYCGGYMSPQDLRAETGVEIDHILPYSRSFDDSFNNKVACHTGCNREKGNRTPFEHLSEQAFEALTAMSQRLPRSKRDRLLMQDFGEDRQGEWKERHLTDSKYIARLLKNHIETSLKPTDRAPRRFVQTRNGALTSHLRGRWGLGVKDRENDRHHAMDALIVACATEAMVQQVTAWQRKPKADRNDADFFPPKPWETFREDALAAFDAVFVSRMPDRKTTGAMHEDTIKSLREGPDGEQVIVKRTPVENLKLADLKNLVDVTEIEPGRAQGRNTALYQVLYDRLSTWTGKPDKVFEQPVHMPTKDGRPGPVIRSVRLVTSDKSGVPMAGDRKGGIASNGDMVRTDVYRQNGKWYLVPVYVHHVMAGILPDKAIVAYKPEEDWRPVSSEEFQFSLHKNDYVRLKKKNGDVIEGYFVGTDRSTGAITLKSHDGAEQFRGIGIQSMVQFRKFRVSYFGDLIEINGEPRHELAGRADPE